MMLMLPMIDAKILFALEIQHNTAIKAKVVVNMSPVKMARLKMLNDTQLRAWTAVIQKILPNVVSGDRLNGVYLPLLGGGHDAG